MMKTAEDRNIRIVDNKHNYGIDVLRIVSMFMIVAHHFALHSGVSYDPTSFAGTVMSVLALGGKTGVNIFVLITGYYSSGRIRKEKILELIAMTTFYSVVLTIAASVTGRIGLSQKTLLKAAFPALLGNNYWFIVTYLELYLLIPLLDKIANILSAHAYRRYLALFTVLLCLLPPVAGKFIQVNDFGYSTLVWFVYLYFLGAYLRKDVPVRSVYLYTFGFVQITATVILSQFPVSGVLQSILQCVADYSANAPIPLLIAVMMLLKFRNVKIARNTRLIKTIGAATLGIYLFHDNVNFRNWMWAATWRLTGKIGSIPFAIHALLSILIVFTIGLMVEICRKYVFDRCIPIIPPKKPAP